MYKEENLLEKTFIFDEKKFTPTAETQEKTWEALCEAKDKTIQEFKKTHSVKASQVNSVLDRNGYLLIIETLFYKGE
jgi:hypothetical protein